MKKIFYAMMAVAAISFSACTGTTKGGSENDSINADSVVVDAAEDVTADATISKLADALANNDTEQAQTLLQQAQAYIAKLQQEGKLEEAKAYIAKLQQFISENEEKITPLTTGNETLNNLVAAVKALPVDAAAVAEGAKDAAVSAANEAANAAASAANEAANKAVETGKQEAGKAIDKAAEDTKSAIKGKLGL